MFENRRRWWFASLALFGLLTSIQLGCGPGTESNNQDNTCNSYADCEDDQRCTSEGVCSSEEKSCETFNDCTGEEYCADGICAFAECDGDDQCVDGYICDDNRSRCVRGCRTTDDCADGEACNPTSNQCEVAGCTVGSCNAAFEMCDVDADPPECIPSGDCSTLSHCVAYQNFVDDGNEYICDTDMGRCIERPPCGDDDECQIGEICVMGDEGTNECRRGCREDMDCPGGQVCNPDTLKCIQGCQTPDDCQDPDNFFCIDQQCIARCESADDCEIDGQVCRGVQTTCQGCTDDSQCPTTQFCDKTKGTTDEERQNAGIGLCIDLPPTCPDDPYADNHALDQAHTVSSFPFEATASANSTPLFCKENAGGEYFKFNAEAGKVLEIELTYDTSQSNLDLALLDSAGQEIVRDARPPNVENGREFLVYGVPIDQELVVNIRGTTVANNIEYGLTINQAFQGMCPDDAYEDNDTIDQAKMQMGATLLAPDSQELGLTVCGSPMPDQDPDSDFYKLEIDQNQVVTVTAQAPFRLGDIDMYIYDETGSPVLDENSNPVQSTTDNSVEEVIFLTEEASDYFLEIRAANGAGIIDYDLEWTQRENNCSDDFETNETCGGAREIAQADIDSGPMMVEYPDLNICTDFDFYYVDLLPQQTLTVSTSYQPSQAAGRMQLRLSEVDQCGNYTVFGQQTSSGMVETLEASTTAPQGGRVFIFVSLEQGLNVPYEMDLEIQDGPPCINDDADTGGSNNDDRANATTIDPALAATGDDNAFVGRKICDFDQDYYAIDLTEGQEIVWDVKFDHSEGNLEAYLLSSDPNAGPNSDGILVSSESTDDDEKLTYTVPTGEGGTYYLLVEGDGPKRNSYTVITTLDGVGPTDPQCPDEYENNDEVAEAAQLDAGSYDLLICSRDTGEPMGTPLRQSNDDDWFYTDLAAGESITVTADFVHADGNIDLQLFGSRQDSNGDYNLLPSANIPLVSSATTQDQESVTYTSLRDQRVFYRLNTYGDGTVNSYTLDVSITAAPTCTPSPSGIDTAADAMTVEAPGLMVRNQLCEGSDHWYEIVGLTAGEDAEVYVNFDSDAADLDLFVYDDQAATTELASSEALDDNKDSVIFAAPADGTVYVRVASKVPARPSYDLLLYHGDEDADGNLDGPEDRQCPDALEDNDSSSNATLVPVGLYEDLSICWFAPGQDTNDWYSITVPPGATVDATVTFSNSEGNINLNLYRGNPNTSPVDQSLSTADTENVSHQNDGSLVETYYVRVFGNRQDTDRSYYDLDMQLSFPGTCTDDMLSANDLGSAQEIPLGANEDLVLCESTDPAQRDDWFAVSNTSGGPQDLFVGLEHEQTLGDIDVEVTDSGGNVLASSTTSENIEEISGVQVAAGETAYIRVFPKGGTFIRTNYDLYVDLGGAATAPYCPDPYERNDVTEEAASLNIGAQNQYDDMIACGADTDWYSVFLTANTTYDVQAFFDHAGDFDLQVEVIDPQAAAGSQNLALTPRGAMMTTMMLDSSDNDELGSFTPTRSGTHFVGVRNVGTNPIGDDYFLYLGSQSTTAQCPTDDREDDDNLFQAKGVPSFPYRDSLSACGDDDFFRFTAPQAGTVTVTAYFDNTVVNLGMSVTDPNTGLPPSVPPGGNAVDIPAQSESDDRASVTFLVESGKDYVVNIGRALIPGSNMPSDGRYFIDFEIE